MAIIPDGGSTGSSIEDADNDGYTSDVDCDDSDESVGEPSDIAYVDNDGDGFGTMGKYQMILIAMIAIQDNQKMVLEMGIQHQSWNMFQTTIAMMVTSNKTCVDPKS